MTGSAAIAAHLDSLLGTAAVPDYSGAVNGLQLANRAAIRRVAASVDVSRRVIEQTIAVDANLLLVHHGMFWGGVQPVVGATYDRFQLLLAHDIAVYSAHLPLDAHASLGNNVLLARALGLEPAGGFARYKTIDVGVQGTADIDTRELRDRATAFAQQYQGSVRCTPIAPGHRTRRWALCTGAGASSETVLEAQANRIDTLIVGEGPHHTAVAADDAGIVVIYAGHYATETLGVRAVADHVSATFGIPSVFIDAPTGL